MDQAISAADGAQAEAASLYRERALRAQLTGHRDALDVVAPELGLDGSAQYVCLVIRLVDRWRIAKHLSEEDGIRLSLRCEQICADAIAGRPGSVSFKNRISEFVVLLKDEAEADAEQTAQRIETALWNELTFHASAGLSGPFRPEALRSAYQEACAVIERRHFQEAASSAGDPVPSSPDGLRELAQTQLLGALLQMLFHAAAKIGVFLCAGSAIFLTGTETLDGFPGLGRRLPATMVCFTLLSLSLVGIPPFGGFFSKWYLISAALADVPGALGFVIAGVLLFSALLTAGYLFPPVVRSFFPGRAFPGAARVAEPLTMVLPLGVMAAVCLLLGLFPNGILAVLRAVAGSIL